jgi:hypothetical protein
MEPEQSPANETALELREHKDGVCEIYANFIDICWGLHDVRLRLARVVPTDGSYGSSQPLRVAVEQNAALTMPWGQAKLLRDILIDAVERYELVNGELKWPELAAQNVKEFRQQQLLASAPEGKVN